MKELGERIAQQGAFNLGTLQKDLGFGMRDRLRLLNGSMTRLDAVENYRSDFAVAATLRNLEKQGIEPPSILREDESRRYLWSLWGIAFEHTQRGNNDFLEKLVELYRAFGPDDLGFGIGGNKILGHLQRMAEPGRSKAEQDFSLTFLNFYNSFLNLRVGEPEIIWGEGHGTLLFWTLGPYLQKELQKRGHSPRRAFYLILKWGQFGSERSVPGVSGNASDLFVLENDFPPSHQLAQACAEKMADLGIFEEINQSFAAQKVENTISLQEKNDLKKVRTQFVTLISRLVDSKQ